MEVREIELGRIDPNIRFVCDEDTIEDLASVIRRNGQGEPIRVWFAGESFRILDGEKRWRACKRLGMTTMRAVIETYP